jgi:hypothetical protein
VQPLRKFLRAHAARMITPCDKRRVLSGMLRILVVALVVLVAAMFL